MLTKKEKAILEAKVLADLKQQSTAPKRRGALIPVTRPLNAMEKLQTLLLAVNVHGLIRDLDDLSNTNVYSSELRRVAILFLTQLEIHARKHVWDSESRSSNPDRAMQEAEDLARESRNIKTTLLIANRLQDAQKELFWQEMTKQFKRFDLPLRLDQNGNIEATKIN